MGQDVMASDDISEFPPSYRYIMNGTELNRRGLGSVRLVPLSTNILSLSSDEFSRTDVGGNLVNVNASNAAGLPAYTIPYISCDDPDVMTAITDSFNSTEVRNVIAAILYSETRNHCNISRTFANAGWANLLTVFDVNKARQIAALELGDDSLGIVQIFPDLSSLPASASPGPERRGSPIPMIILYALTSMITVLLLIVIVGGAIKARRHPERYGPRAIHRPRQSRAKGIAMAILETLPIVRFGDPEPKQRKSGDGERDIEMTATVDQGSGEARESRPIQSSKEAEQLTPTGVAVPSRPASPRVITDDASTSQAANHSSDSSASAQKAPESPLSKEANLPKEATDPLSCSICTEDFSLGEQLRVLPCNHKFHPLCVDPWLLNVSGTCPLCRIDLCPPQQQQAADDGHEHDDGQISMTAIRPPPVASGTTGVRPRSTIGSIMRRSILSVDLQAMRQASQDERLSILRRWREERRRQPQSSSDLESAAVAEAGNDDPTATGTPRPRPNASAHAHAQRRSSRLSQWFRDGFHVRSSESMPTTTDGDRPRTWYAGAGTGDSESAPTADQNQNQNQDQSATGAESEAQRPQPQSALPITEQNARTRNERRSARARSWYGDPAGPDPTILWRL